MADLPIHRTGPLWPHASSFVVKVPLVHGGVLRADSCSHAGDFRYKLGPRLPTRHRSVAPIDSAIITAVLKLTRKSVHTSSADQLQARRRTLLLRRLYTAKMIVDTRREFVTGQGTIGNCERRCRVYANGRAYNIEP